MCSGRYFRPLEVHQTRLHWYRLRNCCLLCLATFYNPHGCSDCNNSQCSKPSSRHPDNSGFCAKQRIDEDDLIIQINFIHRCLTKSSMVYTNHIKQSEYNVFPYIKTNMGTSPSCPCMVIFMLGQKYQLYHILAERKSKTLYHRSSLIKISRVFPRMLSKRFNYS